MNWFSKLFGSSTDDEIDSVKRLVGLQDEGNRLHEAREKEQRSKLARMKYPKEKVDEEALIVMGAEPSHYLTGVSYPMQVGYACPRCKSNGKQAVVKSVPINQAGISLNTTECPECGLSMWFEYDYGSGYFTVSDNCMYIAEFASEEVYATNHSILEGLETNEHDME